MNLQAAEEKLEARGREKQEMLEQQNKQEEKVKTMAAELKQRKKIIRTQQSLLVPRIISGQKVELTRDELSVEVRWRYLSNVTRHDFNILLFI